MFIGEYQHRIDEKGRMAVPVKFRILLKKGAVVTRGIDNCLFLYPREQWAKIANKLANMPVSQARARAFSRLMIAGAMEVDFDNQGRISLPEYLRIFAGLKKKAIIAGLYDRLEIWDEENWNKYKNGAEKESTAIAESLAELGI
ncbi:MAG: division/cell wall cluster transcriptional repressor MraZ [Candidatus Falkowbacteria bacterium]|nr:division/cell wall cluster transcriptional repressor MraZ [Candidatus Falkowbacteria bacterium]